ncbi:Flp pilus assembly secretin CpaC [Bradyrhizobium sp. RT9b]
MKIINNAVGADKPSMVTSLPSSATLRRASHVLWALALLFPLAAAAQTKPDGRGKRPHAARGSTSGTLGLSSSQGEMVHLAAPATSIFVADPTIADYQAPSNTTVFACGKNPDEPVCSP